MDWHNFEKMDPHLLVGIVNTELRNQSESLDDLCLTHDIDRKTLCNKLENAGYRYLPEHKRFS